MSKARTVRFKGAPDIDAAVEHILWCVKHQSAGYIPIQTFRPSAFLAENDSSDTHRTLADICKHYQVELKELSDMRVASRSGLDNVLMAFKDGTKKHTKLFDELLAKIKEFGAELVILETAADLFGGNENVRNEVRTFLADCCGRIAREAQCAVLLNAHPSVAGMRTGVGDGGSTAWNNTVRSRLSLYRDKGPDNSEDDTDIRILEIKKSNLSKTGEKLTIRWKDNVYIREDLESSEDKRSNLDKKIIDEIRSSFEDGDPWSARHQSGPNYFVTRLKGTLKLTQGAAKTRLNNLLHRGEILEVEYDKHRHLKGLCVPDQAEKLRAKQIAKVRKRAS